MTLTRPGIVLWAAILLTGTRGGAAEEPARFVRGDSNLDGRVTLADVFSVLRYLSLGSSLSCLSAADTDGSGDINHTDALFLLWSIFYRHGPLPAPFPRAGQVSEGDRLGCRRGLPGGIQALQADGGPPGDGAAGGCEDGGGGADLEFIHFRGPALVYPGEEGVRVPIHFNSVGGIEGFTLSVEAASPWIHLQEIDFAGSMISEMSPPVQWKHVHESQREDGFLAATVALNLSPPFRTLPDLLGGVIAYLEFSVDPAAPPGARGEIAFHDSPGTGGLPPIQNEVSRKGITQFHRVCGLTVEVYSPSEIFIRGDVNRDRQINLIDVVHILRRLFAEGALLPCPDAADVDDSGRIALTDAIAIVSYLFGRGDPPAPPFPQAGRDPDSPDGLDCGAES